MTKRIIALMLALCLLMTTSSVALMEEDIDNLFMAAEVASEDAEAVIEEEGGVFELGDAEAGADIEVEEEIPVAESAEETAEPEQPEAAQQPETVEAPMAAEPEQPEAAQQPEAVEAPVTAEPEQSEAAQQPETVEAPVTAEPVVAAETAPAESVEAAKTFEAAATPIQFTLTKNSKKTINLGETLQINLAAGKTAKKYKSSKAKVASVDANGLVTPKKAGKATISVTLNTKKKKVLKLTLTVKDPTIPTSVYLSRDGARVSGTITVAKGASVTLVPVLNSAIATSTYKWSSSKKKIASVSGGVITPKKVGTTKITVTTVRGKKKASIKVKVIDPYKATAVKLNKSGTVLLPQSSTLQLQATMTPANSTSTLKWSTSNKKIATVSKTGVVTGKKKGTAKITVKTSSGKKASVKVKVIAKAGTATGMFVELPAEGAIMDAGQTSTYIMSLNPVQSNGNVTWTSSEPTVVKVKRYYRNDDLTFGADLTAVGVGKAIVTVKDSISGQSRSFSVTVKSLAEPGSITFPKGTSYTITRGQKKVTCNEENCPGRSCDLLVPYMVWDKGDPTSSNSLLHPSNKITVSYDTNIANIWYEANNARHSNGRCQMDLNLHINGKNPGTTTVTVTLANGVKNSFTLTVK